MDKYELDVIDRNFRIVSLLAFAVLSVGILFYHTVEKLSWVDSLYFCVITLTTIGYGDIAPHSDIGKIFTCFYVIAGVAIIASFANLLIKRALAKRQSNRAKK